MGKISGLRNSVVAATLASVLIGVTSAGVLVYPFHRHRWAPWAFAILSIILGMAYITILMLPTGGSEPPAKKRASDGSGPPSADTP